MRSRLREARVRVGLDGNPEPAIGMHIRHGDSCRRRKRLFHKRTQRKCFNFTMYMTWAEKMRKLYQVKRIFISTDDPSIAKGLCVSKAAVSLSLARRET
ncbi:hypothetical protein CYMTET_25404 [Cymbomonas tetramitiformis]|uniref:Uncharacterized protein n=1 Tax=Cymbomonas tetramitiformis TaxID=36881 RepID=A0AAE0FTV7_9CHLO|nr:hypothetical protein CYMTET_25404 [Cymbomonas tetramitiformis]